MQCSAGTGSNQSIAVPNVRLFIDESGSVGFREDLFVVGAVICVTSAGVSEYDALRHSIELGRRQCSRQRGFNQLSELHFSKGLCRSSEQLIGTILTGSIGDRSLATPRFELPSACPICFRVAASSPRALGLLSPEHRSFGAFIRASALIDIMLPFILTGHPEDGRMDVMLDDLVWSSSVELLRPVLKEMSREIEFSFRFADSHRVPGLQLADILSGICRRHALHGDCEAAYRIVMDNYLDRLKYRE
jgi:hypothetical protein